MPHYMVVGVGAGPANLSLAALGEDLVPGGVGLFERRPGPASRAGSMHPGARLQTSWLKDLATLVAPRNRFTFLSYLVDTGRVYAFLTAQFESTPRLEYAKYLAWVGEQLGTVHYGVDVDSVTFDRRFVLHSRGEPAATADHVVFGLGTQPSIPRCFDDNLDGVVLAEDLAAELRTGRSGMYEPVTVVGGGQTSAECVLSLVSRGFRDIRWIDRRHWFAPRDDSPSASDFYRPMYLRLLHGLSDETRHRLTDQAVLTSDGISMSTLQEIYQLNYETYLAEGRAPVMMLPGREVVQASYCDGTTTLWCEREAGGRERHTTRQVVVATGRKPTPLPLSGELAALIEKDDDGEPLLDPDYSVRWRHDPAHRIFVQNRPTHGLLDPSLSLRAVRNGMILNSLFDREVFPIRDELVNTSWT